MEKPDCVLCRKIWAEKDKNPPCEECIPELKEENADAVKVFALVKNQLIFTPNGPIDLNLLAVVAIMDELKITNDREDCINKIMILGRHFIENMRSINARS